MSKRKQLQKVLRSLKGCKIIPSTEMDSDAMPVVLVSHKTLKEWLDSGFAIMYDIGDIQINDEAGEEDSSSSDRVSESR